MKVITYKDSFFNFLKARLGIIQGTKELKKWMIYRHTILQGKYIPEFNVQHKILLGHFYAYFSTILSQDISIKKQFFNEYGESEYLSINHQLLKEKLDQIGMNLGEFTYCNDNQEEQSYWLCVEDVDFKPLLEGTPTQDAANLLIPNDFMKNIDKIKTFLKEKNVAVNERKDFYFNVLRPVLGEDFEQDKEVNSILKSHKFRLYWDIFKPHTVIEDTEKS